MNTTPECRPPFVQEFARPLQHEPVSERYFRCVLHSPKIAAIARPGQFVMLAMQPDDTGLLDPLLPRPLALLDVDADAGTIALLYFVHGRGTALFRHMNEDVCRTQAKLDARPAVRIIGPLGNGFLPIEADGVSAHIGVGGGSGVAPLVYFFRRYAQAMKPAQSHLILAARSGPQLARRDVVSAEHTTLHEATDDGTAGFKGNAIQALIGLLETDLKDQKVALYLAGPEPMMEAGAQLANQRGFPARVSLEARMACGVGVCRACIVDGTTPHPKSGLKRRVICQDGPVFDPRALAGVWSHC